MNRSDKLIDPMMQPRTLLFNSAITAFLTQYFEFLIFICCYFTRDVKHRISLFLKITGFSQTFEKT